jgi:2-amino-4-hydroxy-6-hydroxymethyldihydropteridine diphosphokinase
VTSGVRAFLSLGSNQADRAQMLARAQDLLLGPRIRVVARSHVYESPPWGFPDQPWFLNQAIEIQTTLSPRGLLARCQGVEQSLGRLRTVRWGPRTIDVDILLYDDVVMSTPDLVIPHPELRRRAFVLVPLAEIAPSLRLPTGETVAALLDALPDRADVRVVS